MGSFISSLDSIATLIRFGILVVYLSPSPPECKDGAEYRHF